MAGMSRVKPPAAVHKYVRKQKPPIALWYFSLYPGLFGERETEIKCCWAHHYISCVKISKSF